MTRIRKASPESGRTRDAIIRPALFRTRGRLNPKRWHPRIVATRRFAAPRSSASCATLRTATGIDSCSRGTAGWATSRSASCRCSAHPRDTTRAHASKSSRAPTSPSPSRSRAWTRSTSCPASRAAAGRRRRRCAARARFRIRDRLRRSRSDALARRPAPGASARRCAGAAEWNALARPLVADAPARSYGRRAREPRRPRSTTATSKDWPAERVAARSSRGFPPPQRAVAAVRQRADDRVRAAQRRRPARTGRRSSSCWR